MSLFESLASWISRDRDDVVHAAIAPAHVTGTPPAHGGSAVADRHYVRITVAGAYLAKATRWFAALQPLVHAVVRLQHADRTVDLPHVSSGDRVAGVAVDGGHLFRNLRLTPLLPFRGGDVMLQVGLVAMPSEGGLQVATKLLSDLGELVVAPPLATALRLAPLVTRGLEQIAGVTKPRASLGFADTYDRHSLVDGYVAIVGAPSAQIAAEALRVVDGTLHVATPGGTERLTGVDWLLLRIEVADDRDDWAELASVAPTYRDALTAAAVDPARADAALAAAVVAIWQAPELTEAHRAVIVTRMKAEIAARLGARGKAGLEGVGDDASLADLVAGADLEHAAAHPMTGYADLYRDWPFPR